MIKTVAPIIKLYDAARLPNPKQFRNRARFGSTYTKIGTIQRLAWPLSKDDTQIREAFHMFFFSWGGVEGWGEKAYNCN